MGNPIAKNTCTGTIGELLVQLKLLQYGVQAAQPIKDSGNDLIAIKKEVVKFIQVKATTGDRIGVGKLPKIYHVLAMVFLKKNGENILLDESEIFLLEKRKVNKKSYSLNPLKKSESTYKLELIVEKLFKSKQ